MLVKIKKYETPIRSDTPEPVVVSCLNRISLVISSVCWIVGVALLYLITQL